MSRGAASLRWESSGSSVVVSYSTAVRSIVHNSAVVASCQRVIRQLSLAQQISFVARSFVIVILQKVHSQFSFVHSISPRQIISVVVAVLRLQGRGLQLSLVAYIDCLCDNSSERDEQKQPRKSNTVMLASHFMSFHFQFDELLRMHSRHSYEHGRRYHITKRVYITTSFIK